MFAESIFPWIVLDFNTSKNLVDYFSAIGPTVAAGIAIIVAIWQACIAGKQIKINKQQFDLNQQQLVINKQQLEFNEQQMEIQRCNFVYGSVIKEKQDKLLELRRRFLEFKDINMLFLSILFPCAVTDKKYILGTLPRPCWDIDEKDFFVSYYIDSQEIPNNLIEKASKINADFYQFLDNNRIFLNDNHKLYLYLYKISYGFREFFRDFLIQKDLCKEFNMVINKLIKTKNLHSVFHYTDNMENKLWLQKFRQYFYTNTRYRFCIDDEGINTHILYRGPDSIFEIKKLKYDEVAWASSNKIAFYTRLIFLGWFQFWQANIDYSFSVAFTDMQQYAKSDLKKQNDKI